MTGVDQSGSGRERPVRIDVTASSDAEGRVRFSHEWKFEGEPGPAKSGRIDLPAGQTAYRLQFFLADSTSPKRKLRFKANAAEAMYVAVGQGCPTGPGDGDGQIDFAGPVTPNLLTVVDRNAGDACILGYTLRFDGDPGEQAGQPGKACPPYEYDPEIKNGGGNVE